MTNRMFYDIECLENVFTLCNLRDVSGKTDWLDVYILCQDAQIIGDLDAQKGFKPEVTDMIWNRIRAKNKNFRGGVTFYDLRNPAHNLYLIRDFGADDSDNYKANSFARLNGYKAFVKDTDAEYDETKHPYILGYNSANYDSTMLALYFDAIHRLTANLNVPTTIDPAIIRRYNDEIFANFKDSMSDYLKSTGGNSSRSWLIRQNMLRSGRHIDVAKLNEKQQKVGLKRILGMMGKQILESNKFMTGQTKVNSLNELADLIAYNASDVVNLREVADDKVYKGSFELKKGLLNTYPELIYKQDVALDDSGNPITEQILDSNGNVVNQPKLLYRPRVAPDNVRYDRLYIDSSSAQLAAKTLCPYGQLTDIPAVSYMYPSERQALELGIPRVNVLDECNKFFNNLYVGKPKPLAEWQRIYRYYKFIEGKNFNGSNRQLETYPGISVYDSKNDVLFQNMVLDPDHNNSDEYIIDDEKVLKKSYVPTNYQIKETRPGFFEIFLDRADENCYLESSGFHIRPNDRRVYNNAACATDDLIYDAAAQRIFKKEYAQINYSVRDGDICDENGVPTGYYVFNGSSILEYYNADGNPTGCYVLFGVGGIHGAEYNKELFEAKMKEYFELKQIFDKCKRLYPDPLMLKQKPKDAPKGWKWSLRVGEKHYPNSFFLKSGSTSKKAEWKDISKNEPKLFKENAKKLFALNPDYTRTSVAECNHDDFTSYYPNMLRMMDAFYNEGLGYDRYAEIFYQKEKYGKLMKDKSITPEEQAQYAILREGTKLILNSASGAADAKFATSIQTNNQIISMRIIGQLFTWRIGQAQSYAGGIVPSTNTDGLFTILDRELNNQILIDEGKAIHVDIEPELCFLVSKDSNNRLEENSEKVVYAAAGGSLGCYKGPNLQKALSHPALIDRVLGDYLRNVNGYHKYVNYLEQPFDDEVGLKILNDVKNSMTPVKFLIMAQHIAASSPGTHTFIFGEDVYGQTNLDAILQHYNRVFYVKSSSNLPQTYRLKQAVARAVTAQTKLARKRDNLKEIIHDPRALNLLNKYGLPVSQIPYGKEAHIAKITNVDETWLCHIENRSLFELTDKELTLIIDSLEIDNYLKLVRNNFEKNWRNLTGNEIKTRLENTENEDEF